MKFRYHRGSLKESMETLTELNSFSEFIALISELPVKKGTVKIKEYDNNPDERIGWNKTCIVMAEWNDGVYAPIGFTDGLTF